MKICYVARHDQQNSADDEGAISHALTQLGHEVVPVPESHPRAGKWALLTKADFLLCHHWRDVDTLKALQGKIPLVSWVFDLIDSRDPTLARRDQERIAWARQMGSACDLMFMTDGDWVDRCNAEDEALAGKKRHHWLPQGADERLVGRGGILRHPSTMSVAALEEGAAEERVPQDIDILFTGTERGGQVRQSFVNEMISRYGPRFYHVGKGLYREALKEVIARSKIVVAPDGPITDRYWSNRVWTVLGFGGFLLHPWCDRLVEQYPMDRVWTNSKTGGKRALAGMAYYQDREELHNLINHCLSNKANDTDWMDSIAAEGLRVTKERHLYRHRCEQLVKTVTKYLSGAKD